MCPVLTAVGILTMGGSMVWVGALLVSAHVDNTRCSRISFLYRCSSLDTCRAKVVEYRALYVFVVMCCLVDISHVMQFMDASTRRDRRCGLTISNACYLPTFLSGNHMFVTLVVVLVKLLPEWQIGPAPKAPGRYSLTLTNIKLSLRVYFASRLMPVQ